jgi:hypothetical protein
MSQEGELDEMEEEFYSLQYVSCPKSCVSSTGISGLPNV